MSSCVMKDWINLGFRIRLERRRGGSKPSKFVTTSRGDRESGIGSIVAGDSVGKSVISFSIGESIFRMSSVSDCFEVAGMACMATGDSQNIASRLTVILRVERSKNL